ncbi:MAG: acyl carrier protein [Spongiibacteraceae bacterium]
MPIKQALRTFILENYLFTDDQSALADADSFLEKGVLDSTGIMEVVFFIEEQFGLKVEDEEMIPQNLDSIDNLVAFVERKKVAA